MRTEKHSRKDKMVNSYLDTGADSATMLEFDDCLIGSVYDKFGEDTTMRRTSEHNIMAVVKVQISPTFFGWLFQFGKK